MNLEIMAGNDVPQAYRFTVAQNQKGLNLLICGNLFLDLLNWLSDGVLVEIVGERWKLPTFEISREKGVIGYSGILRVLPEGKDWVRCICPFFNSKHSSDLCSMLATLHLLLIFFETR